MREQYHPEPCRFYPQACLADQRCPEGHVGRQCLSCLPGYAFSRGCIKCPPFWLNVSVTIIMGAFAVAVTFALARMTIAAAGRPQDMHAISFKLLMNHLVLISVIYGLLFDIICEAAMPYMDEHEVRHGAAPQEAISWAMSAASMLKLFDGTPSAFSANFWSFTCLTQAYLTTEQAALIETLRGLTHTEYQLPDFARARAALVQYQKQCELGRTLLWGFWPLIVIVSAYSYGFMKLRLAIRKHAKDYAGALEFYQDIFSNGAAKAKKTRATKVWIVYVREYYFRIWDIWWPIQHASRYLAFGGPDFRIFVNESFPVGYAAMFLTFGGTLQGITRPLRCASLGPQDKDRAFMVSQAEVECTFDLPAIWIGVFFTILWCVVFPAYQFIKLHGAVTDRSTSPLELNRKYGLVNNGYRRNRWWWESVVFARKFVIYLVAVLPMYVTFKAALFLAVSLAFMSLHIIFDPFDKRCGGILNRLECLQLATWVIICLLMAIFSNIVHQPFVLYLFPTTMAFFNMAYLCYVTGYILVHVHHAMLAYLDKSGVFEAEGTGFRKMIHVRLAEFQTRMSRASAYVTVDPQLGWATVVGSRGDVAEPIYFGSDAKSGRLSADMAMMMDWNSTRSSTSDSPLSSSNKYILSKATSVPELDDQAVVKPATQQLRVAVTGMIMNAVKTMATRVSGPTFSVSAVDFVLRAAFMLARQQAEAESTVDDDGEVIDRRTWLDASRKRDPLRLVGVGSGVEATQDGDEATIRASKMCAKLEEDLRLTRAAVIKSRRQRLQEKKATAEESKMMSSLSAQFLQDGAMQGLGAVSKFTDMGVDSVAKITNFAGKNTEKHLKALVGAKALDKFKSQVNNITSNITDTAADLKAVGSTFTKQATSAVSIVGNKMTEATQRAKDAAESGADALEKTTNNITNMGTAIMVGGGDVQGEDLEMDEQVYETAQRLAEDVGEVESAMQRERRILDTIRNTYREYVEDMFAPNIFKRGLKVTEFEMAIVTLTSFSEIDLTMWWDIFEEQWMYQRCNADAELRRSSGQIISTLVPDEDGVSPRSSKANITAPDLLSGIVTLSDQVAQTTEAEFREIEHQQREASAEKMAQAEKAAEIPYGALKWMRLVLKLRGASVSMVKVAELKGALGRRGRRGEEARAFDRLLKQEERLRQLDLRRVAEHNEALEEAMMEAQLASDWNESPRGRLESAPFGAGAGAAAALSADVASSTPLDAVAAAEAPLREARAVPAEAAVPTAPAEAAPALAPTSEDETHLSRLTRRLRGGNRQCGDMGGLDLRRACG
eukprot:TRINITY_DN1567_c1_g3_i1.p1 TRINITY_DN1567_c1_g3~~TRINITY_DN1567_c1_g3_i1.p1  ORF type:complete len:1289 (+),score=292.43 TRINITY_DN1567_c1_g3_i1:104-3970(+)